MTMRLWSDCSTFPFVTNVLDPKEMSAEQVCETYRRRWSIESLFYDKFIVMQSSHTHADAKLLIA